ncbi:TerS protein [Castellaniella hirudinis]|uniref:TerS protein n=1 Tax=Castellaniella hirudinis TaxID=1144617 RepID=UPI0039C33408
MKRIRSDSVTAAVKAAQAAAAGPIVPPDHIALRDGDQPFWDSIVRARARDTWNGADLENAANLARTKADIERIQKEIGIDGDIVKNERGTPIINPKHTLLETLTRRAMALSRMLHVHAEATVGKSEDAVKALKNESEAKNASDSADADLIPGLRVVK